DGEGNVVVHQVEVVSQLPPAAAQDAGGAAPARGSGAGVGGAVGATPPSLSADMAASGPTLNAMPQKELRGAAKAAGLTWAGLQTWLAEQGIGSFDKQASLTVDAFHRCVAFCNESSWEPEVAASGLGDMAE